MFDAASISMTKLISDFLHGLLDLLGDLFGALGKELERWIREVVGTFDLSEVLSGADADLIPEGCLMEARRSFRDFSSYPSSHVEPGTPILIVKKMTHGAMVLLGGRLAFWDYELISSRARRTDGQ